MKKAVPTGRHHLLRERLRPVKTDYRLPPEVDPLFRRYIQAGPEAILERWQAEVRKLCILGRELEINPGLPQIVFYIEVALALARRLKIPGFLDDKQAGGRRRAWDMNVYFDLIAEVERWKESSAGAGRRSDIAACRHLAKAQRWRDQVQRSSRMHDVEQQTTSREESVAKVLKRHLIRARRLLSKIWPSATRAAPEKL